MEPDTWYGLFWWAWITLLWIFQFWVWRQGRKDNKRRNKGFDSLTEDFKFMSEYNQAVTAAYRHGFISIRTVLEDQPNDLGVRRVIDILDEVDRIVEHNSKVLADRFQKSKEEHEKENKKEK